MHVTVPGGWFDRLVRMVVKRRREQKFQAQREARQSALRRELWRLQGLGHIPADVNLLSRDLLDLED